MEWKCERCHESRWRNYARYGAFGLICTSCGAQGWVTSLMAILPQDHSKAKISVDQSPGDEVVGSVSAYQEWIKERADRGSYVWIDYCSCDRCGGSISVEVVDQLVTERCGSCQQEVQFVSTVPLPYTVHKEPRHYRIRNPHPNAELIALLQTMIFPGLEISLERVEERLKSEEGVVITLSGIDLSINDPIMDLHVLDCQIEAI